MVKLEKIVCFIFTLFIVYLVNKQCSVEGIINLNSFTNCIDDPQWYTLDKNGKKNYCKDIGESASCYDMDPSQQEGWERCLETCGNCANTSVTTVPMDNSALYSGGNGEDFDRVNIDDSRKWLGLGVGDEDNLDVRDSLTKDQEDDIINIFERLETVEDLYDMLLSSISSCFDCSKLSESECISESKCEYTDGKCSAINPGNGRFISCNKSELSCDYTIKDIRDVADPDADVGSTLTENVDGNTKERTYVKQKCETDGECSLVFPTYTFNCNNLPEPDSSRHEYNTLKYEPREAEQRWCLKPQYYDENDVSEITDLMNGIDYDLDELKKGYLRSSIELRNIIEIKNRIFNAINMRNYSEEGDINSNTFNTLKSSITNLMQNNSDIIEVSSKLGSIYSNLDRLQISLNSNDILDKVVMYNNNITPLSNRRVNDCTITTPGITDGVIRVNDGTSISVFNQADSEYSTALSDWAKVGQELQLRKKDDKPHTKYCMSGLTISNIDNGDITLESTSFNIQSNLNVEYLLAMEASDDRESFNELRPVTSSELMVDGETVIDVLAGIQNDCLVDKNEESTVINKCYQVEPSVIENDDVNQIKAKQACANYCVETNPGTNYISINSDNQCRCFKTLPLSDTDSTYASIIEGDTCSSGSYELLDKGTTIDVQHMTISGVNQYDENRKMCKSYFLLENALTAEDIPEDDERRQDKIDNITNMKDRISLYDVCPIQCNAIGCEGLTPSSTASSTASSTPPST
jgi:hypothetical protein